MANEMQHNEDEKSQSIQSTFNLTEDLKEQWQKQSQHTRSRSFATVTQSHISPIQSPPNGFDIESY
jgi:hypothetical protein